MRKNFVIAPAAAAVALGTSLLTGLASPATAATASAARAGCGAVFNAVEVDGGQANWNITCPGDKVRITGTVKDTKADGKCAYIKAFADNGESRVPLAKACPKNTTTWFDWTTSGAGRDIRAYLFTA